MGYNTVVAAAYQYLFLRIYKTVAKAVILGIALLNCDFFKTCASLLEKYDYFGFKGKEFGLNCRRVEFSFL